MLKLLISVTLSASHKSPWGAGVAETPLFRAGRKRTPLLDIVIYLDNMFLLVRNENCPDTRKGMALSGFTRKQQ